MQKILGKEKTVGHLLSQKYRIDYYQREYQWQANQIYELVEDLTRRFDQDYDEEDERADVRNYGLYFLGSIIVSEKDNERYIVDGQQRLTSLTLLLIYLDSLQKGRGEQDRVDITNLIYSTQYGSKSFNLDVPDRNACIEALLKGEAPDAIGQSQSVQNLVARFNDIGECFDDKFKEKALPYFLDWLKEKVIIVEITAASDDDAYTIFETMNDRGMPLSPTDMLKGYLLTSIRDESGRALAEGVWKEQTSKLREIDQNGDANCIKDWLRSQYADKIRERRRGANPEDFERIGTEFHRWVRDNREVIGLTDSTGFATFITNDLRFFTRAYSLIHDKAGSYDPDYGSVFFNGQCGFTLQYPLILSSLRLDDEEETVNRKVRLVSTFIEIMLARRMWNFWAISYNHIYYRVFLTMKDIRGKSLDDLRDELIRQLSPKGDWEHLKFTSIRFSLHRTNSRQVRRLLARLTAFLEIKSGRDSRYQTYSGDSYQIEHLWADHYERHQDEFDRPDDFVRYRNLIGGLVLLPGRDNASYRDKSYEDKLDLYAKHNLLACSLHPIAYQNDPGFTSFRQHSGLAFHPKLHFKKGDLDDRQALYNDLATLCWSPDQLREI